MFQGSQKNNGSQPKDLYTIKLDYFLNCCNSMCRILQRRAVRNLRSTSSYEQEGTKLGKKIYMLSTIGQGIFPGDKRQTQSNNQSNIRPYNSSNKNWKKIRVHPWAVFNVSAWPTQES